jgi:AraC family transcriptional activator of pobA
MTTIRLLRFDSLWNDSRHFTVRPLAGLPSDHPQFEQPHKRDYYLLLYVIRAEGRLIVDHAEIRADQPTLIVVKPGAVLRIQLSSPAEGYLICFREEVFSLRYHDNVLKQFRFLEQHAYACLQVDETAVNRWVQLCQWAMDEYRLQPQGNEKVFRSYLNILLFDMERMSPLPSMTGRTDTVRMRKIAAFEELIERHFAQLKKPAAYADLLAITPDYLNKICRETLGQTAGSVIRQRVVTEAKRLLLHTSDTVSQIADRLGFENTSYFVAFFRKHSGTTPEQFRKSR